MLRCCVGGRVGRYAACLSICLSVTLAEREDTYIPNELLKIMCIEYCSLKKKRLGQSPKNLLKVYVLTNTLSSHIYLPQIRYL